jgi:hypothetical protein
MPGRIYSVSFKGVSVSAVQDLFGIYAGAKAFKVHSISLGQVTATAVGNLKLSLNRLPATVTAGSGGTTPSPEPLSPNDTAATITAQANDTTQATTGGTAQTLFADAINVINGYLFLPPAEDRPIVAPSQAFIVSLDSAPGAQTWSGTIVVEELF